MELERIAELLELDIAKAKVPRFQHQETMVEIPLALAEAYLRGIKEAAAFEERAKQARWRAAS